MERDLRRAVELRLRSDVSLGSFLSGGIDSSLIASFLPPRTPTFCMGFSDQSYDERRRAAEVAVSLGLPHRSFCSPGPEELLDGVVAALDEPLADSSALPMWALCREARRFVTVALSGDGADELFGGYRRHHWHWLVRSVARVPAGFRSALFEQIAAFSPVTDRYYSTSLRLQAERLFALASRVEEQPDLLPEFFSNEAIERDLGLEIPWKLRPEAQVPASLWRTPLERLLMVDLLFLLPGDMLAKVDRMGMAHGLEIRCPFLDHRVAELALRLPVGEKLGLWEGKKPLRRLGKRRLPPGMTRPGKHGFSAPLPSWLRGALWDRLNAALEDPPFDLDPRPLAKLLDGFRSRTLDAAPSLYAVLLLWLWERKLAAQQGERASQPA